MAHEAQLDWERRAAKPAAAAAFAAVLLDVAGQVLTAAGLSDRPEGDRGALIALDQNEGLLAGGTTARTLALVLLVGVLYYLYRCTRYRRGETPTFVTGVLAVAPLLLVVAAVLSHLDAVEIANEFTDSGRRTEDRAERLLEDRSSLPPSVGLAGTLALGFALIVVSVNAMRAGLVSRFMGALGIVVGALTVLPLLALPVVRVFWVAALGLMFLGRWPGGRGPAWAAGEALPWPTAADRAAAREPEPAPETEPAQHPGSRKRKRKRKR